MAAMLPYLYGGGVLFMLGVLVGNGLETARRRRINREIAATRRERTAAARRQRAAAAR